MKMPTWGTQDSSPFAPSTPHQTDVPEHSQKVRNVRSVPIVPTFGCRAASEECLMASRRCHSLRQLLLHGVLIVSFARRLPHSQCFCK